MSAPTAIASHEKPNVHEAVAPLLQRLLAVSGGGAPIVSAYLRLESHDRNREGYLVALKEQIRAVQAAPEFLSLEPGSRQGVERDLDRILHWMEQAARRPGIPALAIFASEGSGLLEAVQLPKVCRTRVVLDRIPRLRELVAAGAAMRPALTLLVDRAHARVFEVTWRSATELSGIVAPTTRGGKFHSQRLEAPGWGEKDFHGRMEEERRRQHAEILQALAPLVKRLDPQGILLAGPKDHTAALAGDFPEEWVHLLLGEVKMNPTAATAAEVKAATLRAAEAAREQATLRLIRSLREVAGRGLAVEGVRETLRAFAKGQVRTLLLPEDAEGRGFRCAATGRLAVTRQDCHGEGEPAAVRDIVDEVVEEALRVQVDVVIVPAHDAIELLDGMGALLRFR
jgi:hypothetical protein